MKESTAKNLVIKMLTNIAVTGRTNMPVKIRRNSRQDGISEASWDAIAQVFLSFDHIRSAGYKMTDDSDNNNNNNNNIACIWVRDDRPGIGSVIICDNVILY